MSDRLVIKIAGESGMGIESSGMIVMKALKNMGFFVYGEREFPSLIKGGNANIQINISSSKVRSLSHQIDIGVAVDREGLKDCLATLKEGGILIHGFDRWNKVIKDLPKIAEEKKLQIVQLPAREIAFENGGNIIMTNVVLLGYLWKTIGLPIESLKAQVALQFAKKPDILPVNYACSEGGFNFQPETILSENSTYKLYDWLDSDAHQKGKNRILIDGNSSIVLGAVQAGVRAYYGYPMSPSSSILTYIADIAKKYGILVKQVEDEITASQMVLGSMHAGTRSMTATSGGGYDLMTETVSLSGMIETPLVIVISQRPGPATGLPTWTGQADLNLAIYSSHGEFARCVIAVSDPESSGRLTQIAFNIAETYQIPVTILTEAATSMSYFTEEKEIFKQIPIERGLVQDAEELATLEPKNRYQITDSGISKRWIPGSSEAIYFANGDEHGESGELNEEADLAREMIAKRIRKGDELAKNLPEPEIFGDPNGAEISLVGWGSTKRTALDALDIWKKQGVKANYLHYEYLWPLKTEKFEEFYKQNKFVVLVEGNHEGQLGTLLEGKTGLKFHKKLLKWDGRPFYVEEILGVRKIQ
jgi:2-oxoglutarate ferredoxin oxidoreductase subunit alpha